MSSGPALLHELTPPSELPPADAAEASPRTEPRSDACTQDEACHT